MAVFSVHVAAVLMFKRLRQIVLWQCPTWGRENDKIFSRVADPGKHGPNNCTQIEKFKLHRYKITQREQKLKFSHEFIHMSKLTALLQMFWTWIIFTT